jgi:hypothetical protein
VGGSAIAFTGDYFDKDGECFIGVNITNQLKSSCDYGNKAYQKNVNKSVKLFASRQYSTESN